VASHELPGQFGHLGHEEDYPLLILLLLAVLPLGKRPGPFVQIDVGRRDLTDLREQACPVNSSASTYSANTPFTPSRIAFLSSGVRYRSRRSTVPGRTWRSGWFGRFSFRTL
jgi:hypothetical protein